VGIKVATSQDLIYEVGMGDVSYRRCIEKLDGRSQSFATEKQVSMHFKRSHRSTGELLDTFVDAV